MRFGSELWRVSTRILLNFEDSGSSFWSLKSRKFLKKYCTIGQYILVFKGNKEPL